MKRKIYDQLVRWKKDGAGKTALLIDGARRVGKSYVAEQFAKAEYKSYLLIDFLIAKSKISNRHNISPIEVKSGKNYTLTSLRKFMERYAEQAGTAYVLHTVDLKEEEGITYLPLYMTPLL